MDDPRFPKLDQEGVKKAVERLSDAMDVKSYPPYRTNPSVSVSIYDVGTALVADGTWEKLGAGRGASLRDVIGHLMRARGSAFERSVTKIVSQCAGTEDDDLVINVDGAKGAIAHLRSIGAPDARVSVLIEILTAALAIIDGTAVAKAPEKASETPLRALYRTHAGGRFARHLVVKDDLVLRILARGLDPLFGILAEAACAPDPTSALGDVARAVEEAISNCAKP